MAMAARSGHNKTIFCCQVLVDGPYNLPLSLYILVTSYISLSAGIKKAFSPETIYINRIL